MDNLLNLNAYTMLEDWVMFLESFSRMYTLLERGEKLKLRAYP